METGRVIHRRYLLQRLVRRGNACAVYQGFDQVLQRAVAVKAAPAEHITAYRAAIRVTSQFSHPNIIGLYDLIVEPEALYIVQEYVDGDDFGTLLQSQLSPYYVADLGIQICQALLYAGTPSRKVSHGDLTPGSIIRDRRGQVRINNFALPYDSNYFTAWSVVGGNGVALLDQDSPPGQVSEGRRDDDTRAAGLLLYQLLAGRNADATAVEPSADGRLRFLRNVPPELCDVIAKAVVRQHPQHIRTPEVFHAELKTLAEQLEPASLPVAAASYPAERIKPYPETRSGKLVATQVPNTTAEVELARRVETSPPMAARESSTFAAVSGVSMKLAVAQPAPSIQASDAPPRRVNLPLLLLVGLVLFALFFGVGYFVAHALIP